MESQHRWHTLQKGVLLCVFQRTAIASYYFGTVSVRGMLPHKKLGQEPTVFSHTVIISISHYKQN